MLINDPRHPAMVAGVGHMGNVGSMKETPGQVRFDVLDGTPRGVRYVSGLTVLEEVLVDGHWIGRHWSAIGRIVLEAALARDTAAVGPGAMDCFRLGVDGQSLDGGWEWVGAGQVDEAVGQIGRRRGQHFYVDLRHKAAPVRVRLHTQLDGSPFIIRWLEITSHAAGTVALSALAVWAGMLWCVPNYTQAVPPEPGSAFRVGYYTSSEWGHEGDFAWEPVPPGEKTIEGRTGKSGWGRPVAIVGNEANGEFVTAELAWSGNWAIALRCRQDLRSHADTWYRGELPQARLALEIGPVAADPALRTIAPGETIDSPAVHLGRFCAQLDEVVQAMHTHARESVLPPQVEGRSQLVQYNAGVYQITWWNEDDLRRHVDIAAAHGAELLIVDAGWYGQEPGDWSANVGDWRDGPWLPNTVRPVREYARQKGLLFGLWMEPESVGSNTELRKAHPDWLLRRDGQPHGVHNEPYGRALDLARPEVAEWVESEMARVIETYDLDLLRLDYNTMGREGGNRRVEGTVENTLWRHCEALYAIVDRLRARFPGVIFENCAGGGGRTDLGILSRFHTTWISDMMSLPRGLQVLNGQTITLPPEMLDRVFSLVGDSAFTGGDLRTELRVPLFSHPCYCGLAPTWADGVPTASELIVHHIDLYKRFVRPMLATCRVYHHTPVLPQSERNGWCVLEYVAADSTRALVGLFRLNPVGSDVYHFLPRGLSRLHRYRLTFENSGDMVERTGDELASNGFAVRLSRALTSELVLIEGVGATK